MSTEATTTIVVAIITAIIGPIVVYYVTNRKFEHLKEVNELLQLQKKKQGRSSEKETLTEDSPVIKIVRSVYLRHTIRPWEKQNDGVERRPIEIWLSTYDDSIWEKVEKVVYYLPSSFPNRIRKKRNINEWFSTQTAAYGDFTIAAEVFFKDEQEPLRINRFINVHTTTKPDA